MPDVTISELEETPEAEPGYEVLDERVVSEEIVEERSERSRAAAIAPGTLGNAPIAWSNDRPSPGIDGSIGLPHMSTARVGVPGTLRLALTGELFGATSFIVSEDRARRQALTFAAGYTPLSWLEVYGSALFASTSNTHGSPELMQVQGDLTVGGKAAVSPTRGLTVGADLGVALFPSIGETGVGAAGLLPRAVSTFDVRELNAEIPLLAHLELGFAFDGTRRLQDDRTLTRIEEFALGVHHYNRFVMAAALEMPLPIATPYVGWRMRAPMGEISVPLVTDPDGDVRALSYSEVVSNVVSLGARITAARDFTFLAGVDLGLSGAAVEGVPATMPWNFILGLSYVMDPTGGGERTTQVVERVVERDLAVPPPPVDGKVGGLVLDADTGEPLESVVVSADFDEARPVATSGEGRFLTHDLPPGEIELTIQRGGYEPIVETATVLAGEVSSVEFRLKSAVEPGLLALSVVGGDPKEPVVADIEIQGPSSKTAGTDDQGNLELRLRPGEYVLNISSDGFLTRQRDIEVEGGARLILDMELASEPEEALVTMGDGELELSRQIHFQTGRAEILPDSYQILDQVIDLIARHDIERIRIEGHTDNQGSRGLNMRLSKQRAEAVRDYLLDQGIAENRIEAEGFGPDRPVAPNVTQRGRAMNRRVEFHIVGHESAEADEG